MGTGLIVRSCHVALSGRVLTNMRVAFVFTDEMADMVAKLVSLFRNNGIFTWTPNNIYAGQIARTATRRAYYEADFILVFVTARSVNTQGEYRRQIRMAMEANEMMPSSGVKVIPILLENCNLPFVLESLMSVRAFEGDALQRLVLAWVKEWQRRNEANDWPNIMYRSYWQ